MMALSDSQKFNMKRVQTNSDLIYSVYLFIKAIDRWMLFTALLFRRMKRTKRIHRSIKPSSQRSVEPLKKKKHRKPLTVKSIQPHLSSCIVQRATLSIHANIISPYIQLGNCKHVYFIHWRSHQIPTNCLSPIHWHFFSFTACLSIIRVLVRAVCRWFMM